ncbi:MAG: RNase adapter RapZ [Gammaproteobacteria bacterium]
MRLVIVSGLSGSGKSNALHVLEDHDFYCIDNLPINLLQAFAEDIINSTNDGHENFAVGIDARNLSTIVDNFEDMLQSLNNTGLQSEVIYLKASDDVIIKRFSETRRKHPLTNKSTSLNEAIKKEQNLLEPISRCAQITFDTSFTNIHELRDVITQRICSNNTNTLTIQFLSFGFKHGIPLNADYVFDVRCLPNPHWEPELRSGTGKDVAVQNFLERHSSVNKMMNDIIKFITDWIPCFESDNKSYMTIAIGCTGGQHRSVYFAEKLSEHFSKNRDSIQTRHRELP